MLKRIKRLLGIGVHPKPLKKDGPFEAARRSVAEKEYASRQAWEERERQWEAKRLAKFRETPSEVHKKNLERGYADLKIMAEHEKRKRALKEFTDLKTNREIASGIVIDPGGTCLCRRCGHTVSAVFDHCDQCNNQLDWNA